MCRRKLKKGSLKGKEKFFIDTIVYVVVFQKNAHSTLYDLKATVRS